MKEWQQLSDEPRDAENLPLSTEFGKWCWKPYYADGPFDFVDRGYLQAGIDLAHELMKNGSTRSHRTNLMQARWHAGWWMMQYRLGAIIAPPRSSTKKPAPPAGKAADTTSSSTTF